MRMKSIVLLLTICLLSVGFANAQADPSAWLRVMQLSYVDAAYWAEVQIDDTLAFEDISFPFTTSYVELPAGEHTLTTSISEQADATASTTLMLEAGHRYSVVVEGHYDEQVTFITIDETAHLANVAGSSAFIINLTPLTIEAVTINGEFALESIEPDSVGFVTLPDAEFVMGGRVGGFEYEETLTPHANTNQLVAVRATPEGEPQLVYQRSSTLTAAEYLRSVGVETQFSQVAALIGQTDLLDSLADDGEFTLFLPVNGAVDALLGTGVQLSADQIAALAANHIVEGSIPPYLLPDNETLTAISGSSVSLNFGPTDSGYWEIEGAPILWDVRLANGVIYGIDGLINFAD